MAVNDAAEVLGIDISKEAIDSCQSHYSANNLSFARMDSTRLALNDECFDAVWPLKSSSILKRQIYVFVNRRGF